MTTSEVFDRVKKATVAIVGMNVPEAEQPFTIFGSGFCIDPVGVVVTCRHVMDGFMEKPLMDLIKEVSDEERDKGPPKLQDMTALRAFAVFYDMETRAAHNQLLAIPCPAQNVIAKTDFDLSIFRLAGNMFFRGREFPYLEIEDYEELSEGQQIGVCGFPLGSHLYKQIGTVTSSFTQGIISSIIPAAAARVESVKGFQLNVTATNGNSGGPVFSMESGKVFGVLQLGVTHTDGSIIGGLTKAEPIYQIGDEIADVKCSPEEFQAVMMKKIADDSS